MTSAYVVLSDRQVLHRADRRGVVITRVQRVRDGGRFFEISSWQDWETGVHVKDTEREFTPTAAERKQASEQMAGGDLDAVPYGC